MRLLRRLFPRRTRTATVEPLSLTPLQQRMHAEFVRPDFLDRLAAFHGLGPDDVPTPEHFATFDAHRRAEHLRALEAEQEPRPDDDDTG